MANEPTNRPEVDKEDVEAARAGARMAGFSLRYPVTVCMVFIMLITSGVIATSRISLEMFPDVTFPFLMVLVPYNNSTPAQTQESITKPIEEVVATVPGVQRLTSSAGADYTRVEMLFNWGQDVEFLRNEIREKVDQIRNDLPEDIRQIQIRNFGTDDAPILVGRIASGRDLRSSYEFLDLKIKRPLERLPGVAEVQLFGVTGKEIDVYLRLDDIKRYRVDVGDLFEKLDSINLNRSLGDISDGRQRLGTLTQGTLRSVDELRAFPVNERGLRLDQVADIYEDSPAVNSGRHLNGDYAIGFEVRKASGANTVDVVNGITAEIEEIGKDPALEGVSVLLWFNQGEEIVKSLSGLLTSGLTGAVLAVVVLWFFLKNLKATLIVGLSIPLSILSAVGFLYFTGNTLNILTMMGLMLATGMLVDNAVVVLESIYQKLEAGVERTRAVVEGTQEVMTAVIAATLTSIIIFVPLIFGQDSDFSIFLGNAGLSIVFALLCSLFISLTLIPLAMGRWINIDATKRSRLLVWLADQISGLANAVGGRGGRNPRVRSGVTERYLTSVAWPLRHKFLTGLVLIPAIVGGSIWFMVKFVPDNAPGAEEMEALRINYEFSENYHYAKIEADYVNRVEEFLFDNKEEFRVKDIYSFYGNNSAQTDVYFDQEKIRLEELPEIRKQLSEALPVIPGATIELGGGGGQNEGTWISANLIGPDPEVLSELTAEAKRRLKEIEDVDEVYAGTDSGAEEVQVRLRRDIATKLGVTPESVAGLLGVIVRGKEVRGFRSSDGEVDILVRLRPEDLKDLNDLKAMVVGSGPTGKEILLEQVARLDVEKVPGQLRRENRRTYTGMFINYGGEKKDIGKEKVEEVLNSLDFPQGYSWSYGFFTQQDGKEQMDFLFNILLAIFMVYFVMASLFESIVHPFAIILSMPFAMVGVTWFLFATGTPANIMAWIGLLVLVGVVVNNGIVLIDHINNLRRSGLPRSEAIVKGCRERFRPICMTAATTIVGLVPLAWGGSSLGDMRYFPMARTVMGGLIASTALTLIVLPTYYVLMDDLAQWARRLWFDSRPRKRLGGKVPAEAPAGD